jgi:hypothetical protein
MTSTRLSHLKTDLRATRTRLAVFFAAVALFFCTSAQAEIKIQYATLSKQSDSAYALNADFRIILPNQLQNAVMHGTPLFFVMEYSMARPRWYWSDEDVVSARRESRVSYNSLTQQYRVVIGADQYRFNTLNEAVLYASRATQWRLIRANQYVTGEQYDASVRLYLNTSKLPQAYQLNSLTQQGWGLNSGWYRFNFTPR